MISPETATFAALAAIFGAGLFSFLLPKVADHYKDMNYRLLKELIDIRDSDGTTEEERNRFDKIIDTRRASYLKKQEALFDDFDNDLKIESLKKSTPTHENSTELHARKKTARRYGRKFHESAWGLFGMILLLGSTAVTAAWLIAKVLVAIF